MFPHSVKAPTIPIPFHKLLKVVAIVDKENAQTKQLLDQMAVSNSTPTWSASERHGGGMKEEGLW